MTIDPFGIIGLLSDPIKRLARQMFSFFRLQYFKRASAKPPLLSHRAHDFAFAFLAGSVDHAISFKNIDSQVIYIAVIHRDLNEAFPLPRLKLLEQFGDSFRVVWTGEQIPSVEINNFVARDFDEDGFYEVAFRTRSFGNGGGQDTVYLFKHREEPRLHSLTISYNWQEFSGPLLPTISIEPQADRLVSGLLEKVARTFDLLEPIPEIDWNRPEFAIARWHRDNGVRGAGILKLHFYQGSLEDLLYDTRNPVEEPILRLQKRKPFCSSIVQTLDDGKVIWISYFKNPLIGYIRNKERYFIAYSPSNFYNWAASIAFDGKRIWFSTHCEKGIYSFDYDKLQLERHETIFGIEIGEEQTLRYSDDKLFLSDSVFFTQAQLDQVCNQMRIIKFDP